MQTLGTLIPIGGNEDKGNGQSEMYTLEYIQEGILSKVVRESGGTAAEIAIIPTASSIPDEVIETYLSAFSKLGCQNLNLLDIRSRDDSGSPGYIESVKKADCIMFSGGDQSKIVDFIGGTVLHKIMLDRYKNDPGFVIAGTSAGAMCMSEKMITGGGYKEVFLKGSVTMGDGMGFISELIIDSHFMRRRRLGRLSEAVARYPDKIGIGLSEDTGLIIKKGKKCEVIGSGMMILFDPRAMTHNNQPSIETGAPMSISNLKMHILTSGDKLDLEKNEIYFGPHLPEPDPVVVNL